MSQEEINLIDSIYHPKIPNFRDLLNAYHAYKTSNQTKGRNIFVEALTTDENFINHEAKPLSLIALEIYAKNYKKGPLPKKGLNCCDLVRIGELLDIELPLIDIIEVENEIFWKRVAEAKVKDKLVLYKATHLPKNEVNWRQLGIEAKLAEKIETVDPEDWIESDLLDTVKKSVQFVECLEIRQMQPYKKVDMDYNYEVYNVVNVPVKDCHHGSLAILEHLENLTSLTLTFGLENIGNKYDKRYFEVSYRDIDNLGK